MLIIIILVYLTISFFEIVPLYKNNQKRELWLYSITMTFPFAVSMLLAAGVKLPKPADYIEIIFFTFTNK
jgi:hypothetical protein